MINITEIRVRLAKKEGSLKATVSMTIDGCFVVHDIKVLQGDSELYIGMPSKKFIDASGTTTYTDVAHPLDSATRDAIKKLVLKAYEDELKRAK